MAKTVLTDLNLNQNELQNFVIQNLASAPANPVEGQMYYNTANDLAYIYADGKWCNTLSTGDYTFQNGIVELTGDDAGKVQLNIASGANAGNVTLTANANGLAASVAEASTSAKGIIEIATDEEAAAGSSEVLAVNPKQLATAVEGDIELTDLSIASDSANYLEYDNTTGEFGAKVDTTVTGSSTKLITSGAVATAIDDFIELTDLSIASGSANYLGYDNTTGEFSANVDTTVGTNDNYLVTSGAVETAIANFIELTDLSVASGSANYLTYNNTSGEFAVNVDTTVTDSSTNLVTSGAVATAITNALVGGVIYQGTWDITSATDFSGITLPVKKGYLYYVVGTGPKTIGDIEWNAGDYLLVSQDVASGGSLAGKVQKIDNTEASDIVRLNATQTLTNKTIDCATSGTGAGNNVITNLPFSSFAAATVVASSAGISATSSASDAKIPTEKAVAAALDAKAGKLVVANGAITPASGVATWTISNTLGTADVVLMIKEMATGDEVIADVRVSAESIIIKFNASAAVAANTYKAVIIGC